MIQLVNTKPNLLEMLKMAAKEVSPEYVCIHEKRIGKTENKITSLEERADFKDQKINELNDNIKEMDKKLDKLNDNLTQFMLQSNKGDTKLELRLKSYEAQLETQKTELKNLKESWDKEKEDNQKKFNNQVAIMGLIFAGITILINVFLK